MSALIGTIDEISRKRQERLLKIEERIHKRQAASPRRKKPIHRVLMLSQKRQERFMERAEASGKKEE
ncbi:MAG: hypothetical protein JJE25_05730 [Bacteroidia bacterium]|nr:hypothetical protein [Bacteroidia bacterium]